MSKKKKGDWLVNLECVVTKEVCCEGCTEEEARTNPFDFAIDEREIGQNDYSVISVVPNE